MDFDFFEKVRDLKNAGISHTIATVVRAEKPTSAKPGDKAIVTADGELHGWIGGSCAQPTVIEECSKALQDGKTRLIRLTTDPDQQQSLDGLMNLPMTCFSGGTLEIFIEPQLPQPRLLVVGHLPVAQKLAQLGRVMGYELVVVDPDGEGRWDEDVKVLQVWEEMPAFCHAETAIVVASHGNYDELGLQPALESDAPYVALVASKKRAGGVLDYLHAQGMCRSCTSRLKFPAGLDIGAQTPEEIALSIMAEIVQMKRAVGNGNQSKVDNQRTTQVATPMPQSVSLSVLNQPIVNTQQATSIAIDPICHMTVDIATAKFHSNHAGQDYYFCCGGCKMKFDAEPSRYKTSTQLEA
jgi:xanthine dehydrogenase accessory factor